MFVKESIIRNYKRISIIMKNKIELSIMKRLKKELIILFMYEYGNNKVRYMIKY